MFQSLRWRIAIPYSALMLLSMLSLGLYLTPRLRQDYETELRTQLVREAQLIADRLDAPLMAQAAVTGLDPLVQHVAHVAQMRVTIMGADGTVLGDSQVDRRTMGNQRDRPEVQQALRSGQGSSTRVSETVGSQMLYVAVPVTPAGRVSGVVRVALPLQQVSSSERHFQMTVLPATLGMIVGGIGVALLIAERVTRPVRRVTGAAHALAQGALSETTIASLRSTPGRDEITVLAQIFGQMAEQVRVREQTLRQQMESLRIEIDEVKKAQQVAELTETEAFRHLKERAQALRQQARTPHHDE
jgi:two-component system, OmpR family, phosphate regulon sensor histidine kinase PhoR